MAGIYNFLCLVIIAIVFKNVIADNYCDLSSCAVKHSHTMCQYTVSNNVCTHKHKIDVLYVYSAVRFIVIPKRNKN